MSTLGATRGAALTKGGFRDRALGLPATGVDVHLAVLVVGIVAYCIGGRAVGAETAVWRAA